MTKKQAVLHVTNLSFKLYFKVSLWRPNRQMDAPDTKLSFPLAETNSDVQNIYQSSSER
jgi:hypothetical protein